MREFDLGSDVDLIDEANFFEELFAGVSGEVLFHLIQ